MGASEQMFPKSMLNVSLGCEHIQLTDSHHWTTNLWGTTLWTHSCPYLAPGFQNLGKGHEEHGNSCSNANFCQVPKQMEEM